MFVCSRSSVCGCALDVMTATGNSHMDKVKTYLLAASGRRTVRSAPWSDDVASENFILPKYEVSFGMYKNVVFFLTSRICL